MFFLANKRLGELSINILYFSFCVLSQLAGGDVHVHVHTRTVTLYSVCKIPYPL